MEGVLQLISSLSQDWKFIITLIAGLVAVIYFYATRNFGHFKSIGLPNPKPYPFLGNSGIFLSPTGSREGMVELVKKHGKVFGMFQGSEPQLVVADNSFIKEILVTQFNSYVEHTIVSFGCEWIDRNISNLPADEWRRVRQELAPVFTIGRLKLMVADIADCGKDLADHMTHLLKIKTKIVDMKPIAGKFSMDSIARTVFGISIKSFQNTENDFVKYAKMVLPPEKFGIQTMFMLVNLMFPGIMRVLEKFGVTAFPKGCIKFFENIVDDLLKARQHEIDQRNDFLALMVKAQKLRIEQAKKEDMGKGLDRTDIIAAGFIFFTSGYSSISSGFSASVYQLANNQDWQQKTYEEIESALSKSNGEIDINVLKEMFLLEMVVKESMRIATPIPFLDRVATEDNEVKGIPIKKGTRVWFPVHAIHNMPEYYPEPDKFDPMRFSSEKGKQMEYVWLPFGLGPRACIGDRISMMVLKIGLIQLLRSFKFIPSSGKDQLQFNAFSVVKAMVSFEPRKNEH